MSGLFVIRDRRVIGLSEIAVLAGEGGCIWLEGGSRAECESAGAYRVAPGSWRDAPLDAFVIGVDAPPGKFPLVHRHLCFAADPPAEVLARCVRGGGMLLDLTPIAAAPEGLLPHLRGLVEGSDIWMRAERTYRRKAAVERSPGPMGRWV